mmetsp:Transcript_34989/g.40485  ORF Transcript_34989/g.40485 Transcript_34989/m.40485 type:complete len:80 (-) Transcript_34989:44-283(-)
MPINALLDDDFEGDDILMQELIFGPSPRKTLKSKFQFQRLDLEYHFRMCRETNGFQKRYHMPEAAFMRLHDILEPGNLQ